MDFQKINTQVLELISYNEQLEAMSYNNPEYDALEDKIHALQDQMNAAYGKYFDAVLSKIYKQLKSEDEVLHFTDYIAKSYSSSREIANGSDFSIDPDNCISITIAHESIKGKIFEGALYLKPNPIRIGLTLGMHERILWNSEDSLS